LRRPLICIAPICNTAGLTAGRRGPIPIAALSHRVLVDDRAPRVAVRSGNNQAASVIELEPLN